MNPPKGGGRAAVRAQEMKSKQPKAAASDKSKRPKPEVMDVPIGGPKSISDAGAVVNAAKVVPFNPLEHEVLGAAIAQVLAGTNLHRLSEHFPIDGAGIYAIYYTGNHPSYQKLADHNRHRAGAWPIYVGQALPAGARKGIKAAKAESSAATKRAPLKERLKKHLVSISEVESSGGDLWVEDFSYRALVLNDTFIRLGEMSLLGIYAPVWNKYLDGFGNNPAGKERETTKRSQWDTVHPGRTRAIKHKPRKDFDAELTKSEMKNYLDNFNLRDGFLRAEGQTAGPQVKIDFKEAEELEAAERAADEQDDQNEDEPSGA
jgi:hypothetical protein